MHHLPASAIAESTSSPAAQPAADSQRLGLAAARDLQKAVGAALTDVFGNFLRCLPAILTEAAEKAPNPTERQVREKLARTLSANAQLWIDTFVQQVDAHLIGGVAPERMAGARAPFPYGADDSVALASMELRAELRYQKLVTELDARLNRIRLMLYVPVYTKALAPAALFRSLQDTADTLGWPQGQRPLLFGTFDALLVPELEHLYRSLIEELKRLGTVAEKATAESAKTPGVKVPPAPKRARSTSGIQAPADTRQVDAETLSMLQSFALQADGEGYTDSLLAADLLALADKRPLPGVTQDQSWIPLQRIALAGHFLNEAIADPMVPEALKPQHEAVRFPLVKSALADQTLFTSTTHPLSSLIHELLLKAETSRVTGSAETRRMAELLQQVLTQFALAPEFVRQAIESAQPLEQTQIQRFFELQRQQAQQRRDFVIAEAKRVVIRQLEQLTFGRDIPAEAIRVLNLGWGPLLTKRLLQHGAEHAHWKTGLALMEQLLDQLEAREPDEPPPAEWQQLTQTMDKALVAEGMAAERVSAVLAGLEAARKAPPGGIGLGPLA